MSLPLWGQLEKAVDDSQTIEQAIAEAITEHEEDPTAHQGSGESLEAHKTEGVLDHPPGSVLADKVSTSELSLYTAFESLSPWSTVGSVTNSEFPGIELYIESGAIEASDISSQPQIPSPFRTKTKDMLYQTMARVSTTGTNYEAYFGFLNGSMPTPTGFGFLIKNGTLTAWIKSGAETSESSSIAVDVTVDHIYRAYLDADAGTISYFVDGTLVATLNVPTTDWNDDGGPGMRIETDGSEDGSLFFSYLYFSHQI